MDSLEFSEEEIQEQLAILGYRNIPKHRLREFKQDLDELIRHGGWKAFASPNQTQTPTPEPSPPAYTKEKVGQCHFKHSGEGFFLHEDKENHKRQVLTTGQNSDCGRQQGHCDSYARHAVAAKLQLPPPAAPRLQLPPGAAPRLQLPPAAAPRLQLPPAAAPRLQLPPAAAPRLQEEPQPHLGPEDSLHRPLTDDYASSPDTQGRRFIKRKVLRKHKGQTLVCDESIYSEDSGAAVLQSPDINNPLSSLNPELPPITHINQRETRTTYKMYRSPSDKGSGDDDKNSLYSSFWSDGEKQEDEEEMEQRVNEEESKPGAEAQDSLQEETPELEELKICTTERSESRSNEDEYEEEEQQQASNEEESKPGTEAEDSLQEETPEPNSQGGFTGESSEYGSEEEEDNDDEEEEEEEEEEEQQQRYTAEAEDSIQEENPPNLQNFTGESSDDESEDEDEEERQQEPSPGLKAEDSPQEEKPDLNKQGDFTAEGPGNGSNEEEEEEEEEEEKGSSSSSSPAPSLMTSGYGTYRPEEQEGGDLRDEQDSRGDLSEARDDEDDALSLFSFGGFDIESTYEPHVFGDENPEAEADIEPEEEEELKDQRPESSKGETYRRSEVNYHQAPVIKDMFLLDQKHPEDEGDSEEGKQSEELEEEVQDFREEPEDKVESDESSGNKPIKFIDSNVDFSWKTHEATCEWEGNLRQKEDVASCLEERLDELHLEDEDVTRQSDALSSETDAVSMSAFESYIRGMTRTRSEGDLRPKSKSFIRPVMSQQTIKKTDPVAKYFQYKQLWEMFKLPGEKDRRALRWEIKERLSHQPPPPKPRRVYVPNTYVVPTEKKRSALRWEIRNDLANGLLPHRFTYGF